MDLTLHTDGGSRNNPGPAAIAYIVRQNGKILYSFHKSIGDATNNIAEYKALIEGLMYIYTYKKSHVVKSLSVFADSQLMIMQVQGKYKIKDITLQTLVVEVKKYITLLDVPISFTHILREKNSETDDLVKESLFG